ncbi:unnamed protein product [Adineta ricciae]|uniref:Uncharacterized protein n=2 Tax=Adineta ricciae TaxID=249248 RepID=A0A815L4P2_ADIRI|nr:unnamed protein product [Adineta ricciae]
MQQRKYLLNFNLVFIILCFESVLSNVCPNTSCNCTLTNNTELIISCNSTPFLTQLPTLIQNSLQSTITQLRVITSTGNTTGPLIRLPTDICSYTNLIVLDLSSNSINGTLDTSELNCLSSKLTQLDVSSNSIESIDLSLLKTTKVLQSIDLSYNSLGTMPTIDASTYVRFPSTFVLLNVSHNRLTSVDFWPIFVKTRKAMTIDLSHNIIQNFTNSIPISVEQLTETPDPRYFYLNDNHITHLSDLLLEQYGACSTLDPLSTAFFVVGISNVLLTQNPLVCDCQSYNLISYINENIEDFPNIYNGSALLTQAVCSEPNGQKYISVDLSQNNCANYVLPNISNIFCSFAPNGSYVTITPPTYWPTSTTANTGSIVNHSDSSSTSVAWYIILGVILGIVVLLAAIIAVCYLCRHRLCPQKYHSKKLTHTRTNANGIYEFMTRTSMISSGNNTKLPHTKSQHASMSILANRSNHQANGTQRSSDAGGTGLPTNSKPLEDNGKLSNNDGSQTDLHPDRSKPPNGHLLSTQHFQQQSNNDVHQTGILPLPSVIDVATNTANGIKGIPISALPIKSPPMSPTALDANTFDISITSIPTAPSKRAKLLPPIKTGNVLNTTNDNLLNTSAGTLIADQRQQRRSSLWTRKQNQSIISPLPPRPQSMVTQRTNFDFDGTYDEDTPPIPTIESLTTKSAKPIRTVPFLNISVVPAWVDRE